MNRTLPAIAGYLDRLSARPGGTLRGFVSVAGPGPLRLRLVRVGSADPNPAGPGMRLTALHDRLDTVVDARPQPVAIGSWGLVPRGPAFAADTPRCWAALVSFRTPGEPAAVLGAESGADRILLRAGAAGPSAALTLGGQTCALSLDARMRPERWYRLWLAHDPMSSRATLGMTELGGSAATASADLPGTAPWSAGPITFAAAEAAAPHAHLSGRIEDPVSLAAAPASWPDALALPCAPSAIRARWDFGIGIDTMTLTDTGPGAHHGRLVNAPTRGVVGARWSGRETCWRHAPEDYAAIHFHADDLEDCGWDETFRYTIPDDLPSGAYAFHLAGEGGEDWLPFYVLPRREGPHASIAFLASTFTYQAYANFSRSLATGSYRARVAAWGAYPFHPDDHPALGRSTYQRHDDGSGIALSSRLRPILTMRPGFLFYDDPRGSGLRHYPADTHILAWAEAKGHTLDIVTDEDLDDEGVALLAPYRVVLTGSHPEYHTARTLDALTQYRDSGGRLVYLGGNGFYWRIARDPARPHLIEVRRAEGGIRTWECEPGEYCHQLDGQLGGLWRRNRRPPQALVGVGFTAQGRFEGTHYRRLPASYEPRWSWMFEGVPEVFGDAGLSGGGAAGFEMDRADVRLGTPEEAAILARSADPPASMMLVPEEVLTNLATVSGEAPEALLRAEIVAFATPHGGAVFSVGSITFCGSLWERGATDGPVSRLLDTVVRRFATTRAGASPFPPSAGPSR
ncbi:N,N-dimethylformamidase beta subunit family domain-containing protein [Elioraea sp.]|uniref:N,N-dimethylformamidase beta subunit family domain-containing protein n=1 Tax=Elioraea sp. TaxID=2185103 RepID=UPI003F730775